MCGVAVVAGSKDPETLVRRMTARLQHRGPDANGTWTDQAANVSLAHTRLSIIDLSEAGRQPMATIDGRYTIVFNGEVYNHVELRAELSDYPFRTRTDTEVVLAAWARWGEAALDRFLGMFAFAIWDRDERRLIAVRDRFGIKPLVYARLPDGGLALASEIKALRAAGFASEPDPTMWSTYLRFGLSDFSSRTFWRGVETVPAGALLEWQEGRPIAVRRWYDLATRVGSDLDFRDEAVVQDEYGSLLRESIRLRFRSDVPVGINLSGGLDSSLLLGLVQAVQGADSEVKALTFVTGDERYDELPWVEMMLRQMRHPLVTCRLEPADVPQLAHDITASVDGPFGGIPTLAYAQLFRSARREGVIVLLDGQGIDEQWAGYDYFSTAVPEASPPVTQGGASPAVRPECLLDGFAAIADPFVAPAPFPDRLRNLQLRDLCFTKLPRALRYNDRVSMAASTELREPFLDHRLVELALRQPVDRKISGGVHKRMLRDIAAQLLPDAVRLAQKRPVQTPQREWLRGPLRSWATDTIESALRARPDWFDSRAVRSAVEEFMAGAGDNSHWVWQWISVALVLA